MKFRVLTVLLLLALFSSCNVEFSPNATWKDVPSVFCVMDIEEDTVWARVQRCYLGEDNLYSYAPIADSNNYPQGDIQVHLLAWQGVINPTTGAITATNQLKDRWELTYTEVAGKPEGYFSSGVQPMYYCVPGSQTMFADSSCVFELVVLRTKTGDTLATARTSLVGLAYMAVNGRDTAEVVVDNPSDSRGFHFGFIPANKQNNIEWYTMARGRLYQPAVFFYYSKNGDTLGFEIPGSYINNERNSRKLSSTSITESRFLAAVKKKLADNTDTLYTVNNVDIIIYACNEDLNAYIKSQNANVIPGQETQLYSNVEGGVGIFGSRRTHVRVNVPADSNGKERYLPDKLVELGVGFYGNFSK